MEIFDILYRELSIIINVELFFTLIFIVLNILIILLITKILKKKNFDITYESEQERQYLIPIIVSTSICGFVVLLIARYATVSGVKKIK